MLCKDCHAKTGCPVVHKSMVTAKCARCGKETLCVDCLMANPEALKIILDNITQNAIKLLEYVVTKEEIAAAIKRYPELPLEAALTRYITDQLHEKVATNNLMKGAGWGGVHLERVGALVQQLTDVMYQLRKQSITIKIDSEGYPESWDHILIQIMEVKGGDESHEADQTKET
jgi:hypothetical protein